MSLSLNILKFFPRHNLLRGIVLRRDAYKLMVCLMDNENKIQVLLYGDMPLNKKGSRLGCGCPYDQLGPRTGSGFHQTIYGPWDQYYDKETCEEVSRCVQLHGSTLERSVDVHDVCLSRRLDCIVRCKSFWRC